MCLLFFKVSTAAETARFLLFECLKMNSSIGNGGIGQGLCFFKMSVPAGTDIILITRATMDITLLDLTFVRKGALSKTRPKNIKKKRTAAAVVYIDVSLRHALSQVCPKTKLPITTHTHDRRKSIGKTKQRKENMKERKEKTRKRKDEKGKERKEKVVQARKDKKRKQVKEKRKKCDTSRPYEYQ